MGPIAWILGSEVFPCSVRGRGIAVASLGSGASNCRVLTFLSLIQGRRQHHYTFMIYAAFCILTLLFVRFVIPETKGRELESISPKRMRSCTMNDNTPGRESVSMPMFRITNGKTDAETKDNSSNTSPGIHQDAVAENRSGYVVGVDIGGTNLRLALADMSGSIVARWSSSTAGVRGADAVIEPFATVSRKLAQQSRGSAQLPQSHRRWRTWSHRRRRKVA